MSSIGNQKWSQSASSTLMSLKNLEVAWLSVLN